MQVVIKAMDHTSVPAETYMETWQTVHKDFIWLPSKNRYERAASATNTERIESIKVCGRTKQAGVALVINTVHFESNGSCDAIQSVIGCGRGGRGRQLLDVGSLLSDQTFL